MAVKKISTYAEAHSLLQSLSEGLQVNKAAIVRLLVPQAGLVGERQSKQDWLADLIDDVSDLDARLLDAQKVFEGKELVKAGATTAAARKPAAKKPAAKAPAKRQRGTAAKAASARVKASGGAARTKGGARKVTNGKPVAPPPAKNPITDQAEADGVKAANAAARKATVQVPA